MEIYIAEQTRVFLQACLLGAALGLLFDIFRIARLAISTADFVVAIQDVIFFLLCAVCTFLFLMRAVDGHVRMFIMIGEGLGAILYGLLLSPPVIKVSAAVIRAVKAVFRFVFRWIIFPIWKLFYNIVGLILRPIRFLGKKIKKVAQRCKYRLKVGRAVLYNQLVGILSDGLTKKRKRVADSREKESP